MAGKSQVEADDDDLPGTPEEERAAERASERAAPTPKPARASDENPTKKYTHSGRLLAIARELGISREEIDETPSDVLWAEVKHLREFLGGEGSVGRGQPSLGGGGTGPSPAAAPKVEEEEELELPDYLDDGLKDALKKFGQKANAKNKELRDKLKVFEEREQTREQRAHDEAVDQGFDAIDRPDLFGEGSIGDLKDQGHAEARVMLYRAANVKPGDSQRAIVQKLKAAAKLLGPAPSKGSGGEVESGSTYANAARSKVEEWSKSTTTRPSHRQAPAAAPKKSRAAAVQAIREMRLAKNGKASSGDIPDDDEDDDLPD